MGCIIIPPVYSQPPAKVVVTTVFEKMLSKTAEVVGVIDFDKISGVSSEVSGLIEHHYLVEGKVVKQGNIMLRLNVDFIEKNIEILQTQVAQVDIKIQNAQKNLNRYQTLFQNDAASEKMYEDLSDTLKELMKKKDEYNKTIEKNHLEISKSAIRAPFEGIVLKRLTNKGEWLSPGKSVCEFASIHDVVARIAISEDLIRFVKPGERIALHIHALNKTLTGEIDHIDPVADIKSKTFQIIIKIPWFDDAIQNMSVTAQIPISSKMNLKMIKRDARIQNQGKDFIYQVKDGKAQLTPVQIVAFDGEYMGVDNPEIKKGMIVVIDGNDRLRPDQPVEIVK